MKEIKHNFRFLNGISLMFMVLTILLIILIDVPYAHETTEGGIVQIWYYDQCVGWNTGCDKGPGMLLSMIFNLIAAFLFIPATFALKKQRNRKNNHYLSKNLHYTAIYLGIGRMFETFYIITETDIRAILLVVGRFFIPLDNLAMIIFFGICIDIFYSEEIVRDSNLVKKFSILKWTTHILGWLSIMVYFTYNDILETISKVLLPIVIGVIFLISLQVEFKVIKLSKRVEENKKALKRIGQMLFIFVIISLCNLILITTYATLLQYLIRAFKNLLLISIALLYFPAFINPGKN